MAKRKYNAESIQVLEGLEPVRKRPGMYIGSTDSRGLHHLVYEIVDNSVDEALAGRCSEIIVDLADNLNDISIEDNGDGIPVDLRDNTRDYPVELYPNGICAERVIMTVLHAGGKFNNDAYKVSGGLHGVGASVVNALSKYLKVEVFRNNKHYVDEYQNGGQPITKLVKGELKPKRGKVDKSGTKISFTPDEEIFETIKFKPEVIKKRLKEISYLNKGLKLIFRHLGEDFIFYEEKGIEGFVNDLVEDKDVITPVTIYFDDAKIDMPVELAFKYVNEFNESIHSFCNNINTVEGGSHVTGFKTALTKIVNKYAKDLGMFKGKQKSFDGKDVRSGLVAVLSIKHTDPQFEGQTKTKLGSSDAKGSVEETVFRNLELFFDRNVDIVTKIIEHTLKVSSLRKVENKSRENFLKKANSFNIATKLASCQKKRGNKQGVKTELYIVEGDSAGGSAKTGRDKSFQAILPLRGKVLNVEKVSLDKIYENNEIVNFMIAVGTGIGDEFDISKLKYDKIVIMTDADDDGSHIRVLLLTFIFRYMRPLIDNGHVYIAMPPLYKVSKGKKFFYAYTDEDLAKGLKKRRWNGETVTIQRYKGLGEMNPEQLWDTTMNPETRTFKKVEIEDMLDADKITTLLMGDKVEPRRKFIETKAKSAKVESI